MAETTAISWATSTFNPVIGCTKVGPGCDHCYAERDMAVRRKIVEWGPGAPRKVTSDDYWRQPFRWNDKAARLTEPWRVFCASLSDVFDNEWPPGVRERLWYVIQETPCLTWMLLTKRIGNAMKMLPAEWRARLPDNVWMGATVVNQEEADRDIPKLLEVPARVRWLSIEPQLGAIDLIGPLATDGIHWVITGGESGSHARPYVLGWAKDIVRQCAAAGVAVHVKQMGSNPTNREGAPHPQTHWKGADPAEWPEAVRVQQFPT